MPADEPRYDVGGVRLAQPFKVRRPGHFALNARNAAALADFYRRILGMKVSDVVNYRERPKLAERLRGVADPRGFFLRCGSDHHVLVLFDYEASLQIRADLRGSVNLDSAVHHVPFECGSLAEIIGAERYLRERCPAPVTAGRYMPGGNWFVYAVAPDGHQVELYYGLEQVGWQGRPKPAAMFDCRAEALPAGPVPAESAEVAAAVARGIDLHAGQRDADDGPAECDVDGTLLPRPFTLVGLGTAKLFVPDVASAVVFYRDTLGLAVTETVEILGSRCAFLRAGGEHHCLALLPVELRQRLLPGSASSLCALGFTVANYRQLRNAAGFLRGRGARLIQMPAELSPGVDYSLHLLDPEGNCIQLYCAMVRVGADGRPRARAAGVPAEPADWPETIEPDADTFAGPTLHGPYA